MASPKKLYRIYDIATSEFLAEGTARHCANEVGTNVNAIRDIARGKYKSRKFVVVDVTPAEPEESEETEEPEDRENTLSENGIKAAAKAWDAFCEPIRKKYGIPVRRMNNE